jgi:hypothetical protein
VLLPARKSIPARISRRLGDTAPIRWAAQERMIGSPSARQRQRGRHAGAARPFLLVEEGGFPDGQRAQELSALFNIACARWPTGR